MRGVVSRLTPPPVSPPAVYSTKTVHSSAFTPPRLPPTSGVKPGAAQANALVAGGSPTRLRTTNLTSKFDPHRRSKSPITQSIINNPCTPKKDIYGKDSSPRSPLSPTVSFRVIGLRPDVSSAPSTLESQKIPRRIQDDKSSKKPDIPDVFRPKVSQSELVSPSLVTSPSLVSPPSFVTSPTGSRPTSAVLDKPPSGSEILKPTAIRTTLRKAQEIGGTCFMASKREKKDEGSKHDLFRDFHQQKNRDRWSKSDFEGDSKLQYLLSPDESMNEDANVNLFSKDSDATTAHNNDDNAASLVDECENYLAVTRDRYDSTSSVMLRSAKSNDNSLRGGTLPASSVRGIMSDTGQKNGVGGLEGYGEENKRLAQPKEVKRENRVNFNVADSNPRDHDEMDFAAALPSGSPEFFAIEQEENAVLAIAGELTHGHALSQRHRSLDGEHLEYHLLHKVRTQEPQSILKRRHSRDDATLSPDRPVTPEPHGILKRKSSSRGSSSRASSVDTLDGDLVPILKKSSAEDLDLFEPKPILKKKSSTDDELDERPKSILKSARSGEELYSGGDSGVVSPTPILKWSGRCDSEGEELRPTSILKRRDTTDGVRLRVHLSDSEETILGGRLRSDSAPETGTHRSRSPTLSSGNVSTHSSPSHARSYQSSPQRRPSILKNRWSMSPADRPSSYLPDGELSSMFKSRRTGGLESNDNGGHDSSHRPISPSLLGLYRESIDERVGRDARPLSVSDRIAGMEASATGALPGARPKTRASSFSSRNSSGNSRLEPSRRSSWTNIDR